MRKRLTPDHLLEVGVIHGPHGLKGALTIYSHTRPAIGIAGYSFWWLGINSEVTKPYKVKRCWQHGKRILAELEGVINCDQATLLKQMHIWVPADEATVGEGEYLWADLIGCEVHQISDERGGGGSGGVLLGVVVALEEYGAQDILTVRTPEDAKQQGKWMLPFIEDVVLDVDLAERRITVDLPEGMDACFTPGF